MTTEQPGAMDETPQRRPRPRVRSVVPAPPDHSQLGRWWRPRRRVDGP